MKKQYKATIITPFHNTDMSMFRETFKSVKNQTIGFENIEWIIVLHNCKEEYTDAVRDLVGEYENVNLLTLVNDAKSASSPRNYGLQFVTSPYIEFLDSDDSINHKTVEKCVSEMEKHHAQIVVFRMAYRKQNESVQSILTDVTLWNPLMEEIVLTGDSLRCEELFSSINFCTHQRFFDADFIRSNHISFDEKVTMAEDAYFTLTCYAKAEKIVVLPQFIGHYYFVNSSSAVQSMDKSAKELLHFTYGFKKMFDLLIDIHAYYNHFFLTILSAYIHFAQCCQDFTQKDWKTLRQEMGPYAKMLTPPPVNKFFTEEEGKITYQFIVRYLLDTPAEDSTDYRNGERYLARVILENKDTAFGKYYGFETISSIAGFRKKVPLYDHRRYDKLLRLNTEVGESDLITSNRIEAYAYDFDESGRMRTVPVIEESGNQMGRKFINELAGETTFLLMECIPKGMLLNDGTYRDSITGIMIRNGIESFSLSYSGLDDALTSPFALIFPTEPLHNNYMNLLLALRNEDVTQIYGSNTQVVLDYIEMILKHGEGLCRDIEYGTISIPHEEDDRGYREALSRNIPDPDRARKIRDALKNEKKEQLLQTIWPKLKRILARSGGNYSFYTRRVRKYLGSVRLELEDFITPFGIIAEKTEEEDVFKMNAEAGFCEFLPASEADSGAAVLMTEVKAGSVYELILTNNSGIYRMHTNLFVRPVRITKSGFWFEECLKPVFAKDLLLYDGNEFENVLEELFGDQLYDYFFYYDETENRMEILVELEQENTETEYSQLAEERLLQGNMYHKARNRGMKACRVRVLNKETRLMWRDIRKEKFNAPDECFPPIHNVASKDQISVLEKLQVNREKEFGE